MTSKKANKKYYDLVWSSKKLMNHELWPIWSHLNQLIKSNHKLLEIGPGIRPRIPPKNSYFLEISNPAIDSLKKGGGKILSKKNPKKFFNLILAFEVLEHVSNDSVLIKKIKGMLKDDGILILSVPLRMEYWTEWDEIVGHFRRYTPKEIEGKLIKNGFEIKCYAEEHFSKSLKNKIGLKIANYLFKKFPNYSIWFEAKAMGFLCYYHTTFSKIRWINGKLSNAPKSWAGVYIICKKFKATRPKELALR